MKSKFPLYIAVLTLVAFLLAAGCTPQSTAFPTSAPGNAQATALPPSPVPTTEPTTGEPTLVPTTEPTAVPATVAPTSGPITLTDGLGREVTLESPAQRIVSLAPSNTEILFAVGAGDQVVGRDEFSNYPESVSGLPSVGGSYNKYNYESIVALQPDLVLAAEINTAEQVQALEDLGLKVFLLPNPSDLDEMYTRLMTVAKLTGHQAETERLVESLKQRVASVKLKVAASSIRPKVFYELDGTQDPSAPWTFGQGTFLDALVAMAGGENAAGGLKDPYAQISIEELLVQNPDIILLGDSAYGVTPESLKERAGWDAIQAVKDGKVYPFNDDLVSRPGPRLVDGLEALAKIIHPELFK